MGFSIDWHLLAVRRPRISYGGIMQETADLPSVVNVDREMSVQELTAQALKINHILEAVMTEGIHYGQIPGTIKKTLYQAGAEKICMTFRLAPRYEVEDLSEPHNNFYRYRAKCQLVTIRDGLFVGSAMGEASTAEEKYQWEKAVNERHFDTMDPTKRRIHFKKDGTEVQQVQRNCADLANTVLKIACKRAYVSAVKGATAASDILDVDLDEEAVADLKNGEQPEPKKQKAAVKQGPRLDFGRSKGKTINDPTVPVDDLEWMAKYLTDGLKKPERAKWNEKDRAMIALLDAEVEKRRNASPEPNTAGQEAIPDEVWASLCNEWAWKRKLEYAALKAELGIEHASKMDPSYRAAFKQRMEA